MLPTWPLRAPSACPPNSASLQRSHPPALPLKPPPPQLPAPHPADMEDSDMSMPHAHNCHCPQEHAPETRRKLPACGVQVITQSNNIGNQVAPDTAPAPGGSAAAQPASISVGNGNAQANYANILQASCLV